MLNEISGIACEVLIVKFHISFSKSDDCMTMSSLYRSVSSDTSNDDTSSK